MKNLSRGVNNNTVKLDMKVRSKLDSFLYKKRKTLIEYNILFKC